LLKIIALVVAVALAPFVAHAASPNGGSSGAAWVKIFTQWKGAEMPLDIVNGGPMDNFVHLAPAADVSGQNWNMIPDTQGTFRLTTQFRGKDMCLDVVRVKGGGGPDGFLKLTPCGNHEGQYWTSQEDNGWLKLRPQFWKLCLDVVNGGQLDGFAHMAECGDYSGQHWKME
jgi:hypothetical protein